jgi:hypothetical protein
LTIDTRASTNCLTVVQAQVQIVNTHKTNAMAEPAIDPVPINRNNGNNHDEDPDAAEMERMMALQEAQENEHDDHNEDDVFGDDGEHPDVAGAQVDEEEGRFRIPSRSFIKLHYSSVSFVAAIVHVIYVLRTREQVYLSLLYLTSSKLSYILLGNAVLATFVKVFQNTVHYFMNGLRLMETEAIVDHIRWNVTETCIALTMFRQEISVKTLGIFMVIILGKCLHWALELRINHLRMTEEVFYFLHDDENMMMFGVNSASRSHESDNQIWWFWRAIGIFMPKSITSVAYNVHQGFPRVRKNHLKIYSLMNILYFFDVLSLTYCAWHLLEDGPSIFIMFLFESAILIASIMSSSALYNIHLFDGIINVCQRLIIDRHEVLEDDIENDEVGQGPSHPANVDGQDAATGRNNGAEDISQRDSLQKCILQKIASVWRDQRITATFMVELMALSAKFLFHLILFVAVFTLYGLPINIIRDFYLAFMKLKQRLISFSSYRRLTSNMNSRFEAVTSDDQLERAGSTCIICREKMEVNGIHGDCKMLPLCNHIFHKHCLREWLVQQQSCPTCRGDIQANEARAKAIASTDHEEEQEQDVATRDENQNLVPLPGEQLNAFSDTDPISTKRIATITTDLVLCKVTAPEGTSVLEFNEDVELTGDNKSNDYKIKRDLECGVMIVCTASKKISYPRHGNGDSEAEDEQTKKYLKTPDGWVLANDVQAVFQLKPQ